jgi:GNAT superfamily N-acetyltransferase
MDINLRQGRADDAAILGPICYEAFREISVKHNFPPDLESSEVGVGFASMLLSRPDIYSVVAELDEKPVGSNFLWEGDEVAGVGPITIDPEVQNSAIGRELMQDVIRRSDEQGFLSVRLVQAAYHSRSLALYTKLGFNTVESLSVIQGDPVDARIEGYTVRQMTEQDVDPTDDVCRSVHGHARRNEIAGSVQQGSGMVVEHDGRITGYTTALGYFGHSVGESNDDLKALIGARQKFSGLGFLLPTRNSELLRWCLAQGLRIVQPLTLMSRGVYQEPRGAFMPSILF